MQNLTYESNGEKIEIADAYSGNGVYITVENQLPLGMDGEYATFALNKQQEMELYFWLQKHIQENL